MRCLLMEEKEIRYNKAKQIGLKISQIRKEKGYTREVLAERSNISPNYLYNIEIGTKIPNVIIFIDICNALNIASSDVIGNCMDNKLLAFVENISSDFNKLTDKEIKSLENTIKFFTPIRQHRKKICKPLFFSASNTDTINRPERSSTSALRHKKGCSAPEKWIIPVTEITNAAGLALNRETCSKGNVQVVLASIFFFENLSCSPKRS